ncbi:GRIP and coiled-coil domain-containing protein 2 [Homalodisca vitripennis]|nr:GRIP and coiled-coil domain-containing protein 2 [Homalodisca vitripennis]
MTSMNEELNRRGETISSLKEVVSMYEKKVIELNNQQDCSLNTIKQLREELTDRTQHLHDLSNQQEANSNIICQLREELSNTSQRLQDLDNQQNVSNNTIKQLRDELADTSQRLQHAEVELARTREHQGEADHLSTSTVSRVEESGRLRDVDDSFEDRYCKLKVVAAKLKKRATETQQMLDSERQKWATERSELANKLNQLTASARNNQTLQQECDRLGDELETERKECKMLRKAATDAKTSEVNLKVKLEEAQTNIEILKVNLDSAIKERDSINQSLASKEAELETVIKEKIAEEFIRKEKVKEVTELEERLKEEEEKLAGMKKAVESAKTEARKQSVLSLEIQNYEKSLSDMSGQLNAERGRVSSLEAEVQTLQDIRDSLQEQIRLLEERVATEEVRSQQAYDEVVQTRGCLMQAESRVAELEARVGQLTERLESERASAEAATLELASLSSAVQTNTDIMLREKQELSQQVASLNGQLATVSSTLEQTEEELASVRADFDKYKVRAQSVLRKHQSAGMSQAEADAKQQADDLRQQADTLRIKLNDSVAHIEKLENELKVASGEREVAETRCVNLNIALADKTKQLERIVAEHRSQKLSLETLVQCYKNQLEEKDKASQEQVVRFTQEIEGLRRQLREQPEPVVVAAVASAETEAVTASITTRTEPPLLEREDGEGSEYIPEYSPSNSPVPSTPKPLLPLDKLLESSDNPIEFPGEREQLEGEVSKLRAELERSHKRAHHQAALLAETEQDAARKEQLIAVLKKEIGRLERCIQRQPHAQNTEYMKNIIFKFVTLETGEDRLRLVPVITTLLQLSPEETQRLTIIAKGESEQLIYTLEIC